MLATGLCLVLILFSELVLTLLVAQPLQRLKAGQPVHQRSFGISLLPLSPSRIGFILYLALGDYRINVESPETVSQLARARPFALLYLEALIADAFRLNRRRPVKTGASHAGAGVVSLKDIRLANEFTGCFSGLQLADLLMLKKRCYYFFESVVSARSADLLM